MSEFFKYNGNFFNNPTAGFASAKATETRNESHIAIMTAHHGVYEI